MKSKQDKFIIIFETDVIEFRNFLKFKGLLWLPVSVNAEKHKNVEKRIVLK